MNAFFLKWRKLMCGLGKILFRETKSNQVNTEQISSYLKMIGKGKDCVFFAVFGGKMGEGLNIKGNGIRMIMLFSVPLPPRNELNKCKDKNM
jgi:Rad3-related DNA helicase